MQSNNETEDIPGGKQMKTKQITEEITIRKTMMYKRGAEMIKALENCPKEELLPLPIIPAFNDELGKWEFFAEEQKKENGERRYGFARTFIRSRRILQNPAKKLREQSFSCSD